MINEWPVEQTCRANRIAVAMIGRLDSTVVRWRRIASDLMVTLLKWRIMHRRCLNRGGGGEQKREGGGRELHAK